jgi:hypothetical protein
MPKEILKTINNSERDFLGEGHLVDLPRDKKGKFVSKKRNVTEEYKPRSIKTVKVKGTYGTFIVKERIIPDDIRNILFVAALICLLAFIF